VVDSQRSAIGDDDSVTRFGASFQRGPDETYLAALARTDRKLDLDFVRVFYPGAPERWPGKAPGHDVVVSFKLNPQAVLTGKYDTQMQQWFATVPPDIRVNWVYWHEPEDDVEKGAFTAAQFRAAFQHLDQLADSAHNPNLRSTVVLMSWSTKPGSGRDWRDYMPPLDSVDVLAWDIYNRPAARGLYTPPAELLDGPRKAAESVGKPFAVGEIATTLVKGDDGKGRAAWLRSVGGYLIEHDADFAAYFDFVWNDGDDDYRLTDDASINAWRQLAERS
jgi:hypothetical protein